MAVADGLREGERERGGRVAGLRAVIDRGGWGMGVGGLSVVRSARERETERLANKQAKWMS